MLSHTWDVLCYHQVMIPVHTPELHLIAKTIFTVSGRSTTKQEQHRAAKKSSNLITLTFFSMSQHWSATRPKQLSAKMPHSCWTDGAVSLAVHGGGWAFLSSPRHVDQEKPEHRPSWWQNGSLSSSQRDQPYGRSCREALQHQPQLNVILPPQFWLFFHPQTISFFSEMPVKWMIQRDV